MPNEPNPLIAAAQNEREELSRAMLILSAIVLQQGGEVFLSDKDRVLMDQMDVKVITERTEGLNPGLLIKVSVREAPEPPKEEFDSTYLGGAGSKGGPLYRYEDGTIRDANGHEVRRPKLSPTVGYDDYGNPIR